MNGTNETALNLYDAYKSKKLTEAIKKHDLELLRDNSNAKFGDKVEGAHDHFKIVSASATELLFTDGRVVYIISKSNGSIKIPLTPEIISGFKNIGRI